LSDLETKIWEAQFQRPGSAIVDKICDIFRAHVSSHATFGRVMVEMISIFLENSHKCESWVVPRMVLLPTVVVLNVICRGSLDTMARRSSSIGIGIANDASLFVLMTTCAKSPKNDNN
jgi:hypothetical protein